MLSGLVRIAVLCALCTSLVPSQVYAAETIKFALIEPLSGPFANIGNGSLHSFLAEFDRINARGGVLGRSFELVAFDNKSNPQETVQQLQAAIDRDIRYVLQAAGSNNGHALSDAVAKHNARNPDRAVLYLNFGALDPALTTEKCHFWHFRFVPHGHMIMTALTDAVARNSAIKRVYLIDQDYVWGRSVAADAREMLNAKRPDIQIVGDDLHPIGKIKDFAPYVAKVNAARADAIVTGNWGNDLALLIKAAKDADLKVEVYAPLAGLQGAPAAIGEAGANRVRAALFWHANLEPNPLLASAQAYKAKYKEDWNWLPINLAPNIVAAAMNKAGSAEPLQVAIALEGLRYAGPTGEVWMRSEDHQLMMPIYETVFVRVGEPGVKYDAEDTGLGWKTEGKLDTESNVPPIVCKVQRP
jgi:branched-chain amino acid transport system substrate-binding protein